MNLSPCKSSLRSRLHFLTRGPLVWVLFALAGLAADLQAQVITSGNYDAVVNRPMFPYQITTDPAPPAPPAPNPYEYRASNLPSGLSVNGLTGAISGTPTVVGTFTNVVLEILAAGTTTVLDSKTVTFRILEIAPPSISSGNANGEINVAFNYQIVANNSPTSYGASGLPAGLSLNPATGVISGTPTVAGAFNVGISASNASGTGTANVTFNIFPLIPPVILDQDTTGIQGQPFFYAISVNPESDPIISYAADGLALIGGLTLNPVNGTITGIPENAGTFSVVISATNALGTSSQQITIVITGASLSLDGAVPQGETYKLLDRVPWNASVTATGGTSVQPYTWVAYVTGRDIYGNVINIEVGRGQVPILQADRTFDINPGEWIVPNDGTLYNIDAGYFFVVALFEQPPTSPAELASPFLSLTGRLKIDVIPNLAVPSPAIVYPGPDQKQFFQGGDIAQFQSSWFNRARGEATPNGRVQSRPLRALDRYTVALRLTSNPAFNIAALPADETAPTTTTVPEEDDQAAEVTDEVNDDFDLMEPLLLAGDLGGYTPTGATQIRRIEVINTPPGTSAYDPANPANGALNPYGLTGVVGTERCYDPQPYDGFLDIGEQVSMVTEQLIPENYAGLYYVAGRVAMTNPDLDSAAGNNVFVSNSAPKLEIVEKPAPTLQPASAISTDEGEFVDSGYKASDNSSVSDSGEIVAFESTAGNLLIPPQKASLFVAANGEGVDMSDPANYPAVVAGVGSVTFLEIQPFLTVGRQIFLKYNQTGEVVLASREVSGQQANADCFNPSVNAGLAKPNAKGETYSGWYVAYDSKASNLGYNTGGRSAIYVFNTQNLSTAVISRNAAGELANGDSFRPRISGSGRFVVFQSQATNLDPTKTLPSSAGLKVYLHDRNVDGRVDSNGRPVFDVPGNIATYLVSVADNGAGGSVVLDKPGLRSVVNLDDDAEALLASEGRMYVAFTTCARNAPKTNFPFNTVYRASVKVDGPVADRGAIPAELLPISVDPTGNPPQANGLDPVGAVIRPDSDDAAINGDGSVIAFTSAATNLVPEDTNQVPDVFVRDLKLPLAGGRGLVRVSVSDERVATGVISFLSGPGLCNVPDSQPLDGDSITISDGISAQTFVFRDVPDPASSGDVAIGTNVQETRDNLITLINATFPETLFAEPTTPPNVFSLQTGLPDPGLGYNASIYLKNKIPGTAGNVPIVVTLVPSLTRLSLIAASGMQGGGRQAEDDALAPGATNFPPILGVPFGSGQPSIDREGYRVAFRSIATNLDVYNERSCGQCEAVPPLPPFPGATPQNQTLINGELIRPLLFPTANVYLHNRRLAPDLDPDAPENTSTTRASVSKFGYETVIFGRQPTGVNANTSAANHSPAISANGRFISFSSDSTAKGGLIFGANNLDFPTPRNVRNVFLQDRRAVGENPPEPTTRPTIALTAPNDGLNVPPGSVIPISVTASATLGKTIESVRLFINGAQFGQPLVQGPYGWSYTLPSEGTYFIRAVVTDSRGVSSSDSVTIFATAPTGEAPSVGLTQPTSEFTRFVLGSQFSFNLTATDTGGILPDSANFFVNGTPLPGELQFNDTYVASYRPGSFGLYSVSAAATDTDNNTIISPPTVLTIAAAGRTLPTVKMLPLSPEVPLVADGSVNLRAEVQFFGADPAESVVQFYADGVYIGDGVGQGETNIYQLSWRMPATPRAFAQVRARVIAPNSVTLVSDPQFPDNEPEEFVNYASIFSQNFLTFDTIQADPLEVEIIKPADKANVSPGLPVLLEVSAKAPAGQGSIREVEFYQNGELIPIGNATEGGQAETSDSEFPYQINFTPPAPGQYTLVALAFSTAGVVEQSDSITINAVSGAAPTVTIKTPPDGLTTPQAPLNITYEAKDSDGFVRFARLFINGAVLVDEEGREILVTGGQGLFVYSPPSQGFYEFVVRATDNVGNVTDSTPSRVTIDNSKPRVLPEVVISQQTIAERGYVAGSEVFLNATARAFGPNSILTNGVDFFANGSPLGGEFTGFSNSTGQIFSARSYLGSPGRIFYDVLAEDTAGQLASDQTGVSVRFSKQPLPTVQMLKPVVPTANPAGGFVKLQAEAIFPVSAAEQRVEFYVNGKLEGVGAPGTNAVVGTNLFEFNWRSPTNTGSFRVDARAVCLNFEENVSGGGGSGTNAVTNVTRFYSSVISDVPTYVTTGPSIPPVVSIKSPINGAFVPVGSAITLQATASAVGSTIRRVEFYGNGDLIGFSENAANAYSVNYTPSSKGDVVIVAVAETVRGIRGESTPVTIKVPFEGDPTVEITAPVAGTIFPPGTTFTAAAEVTINEVTKAPIRDVRFFLNEVEILPSVNAVDPQTGATTTQPGQPDSTAPYSAQVTLQGVGNYFLKAIATDIYGNTDAEEILVVCGLPPGGGTSPVVYMTHPTPAGQTADGNIDNVNDFSTPSQFFFNAKIVLPSNASIDDPAEDVQFFANGQPIGESGGIPAEVRGVKEYDGSYSIYWQPPGNGTYDITAQATATYTDKNGNKTKITAVSAPLFFDIGNVARFIPSIKLRPIGNGAVTVNSRVLIQTETNQGPEPIDRIDFYADGVLIGSAAPRDVDNTPVTTTFEWIPRTPSKLGKPYIISARAVQVVEGGADFGADNSVISNPVMLEVTASSGSTPLVNLLQQPISETLYVYGSQLFLNATVAARGTATIPADGVKFYYNSEVLDAPKSGVLFGLQNVYSTKVLVEDSVPEITLFATARDSNNATSSSSVATLQADRPLFPLPEAEMLPLFGPGPFSAGEDIVLRARAEFPPTANSEARVEFYANGAYLGAGVEDPQNPGIYIFTWETPETSGDYVIEARAVALNFTRNIEDNNSLRFFGSSISLNSVTAPVQAVPSVLVPGSNGAFVVDIYNELLYRDPSYIEWFEATDALDAGVIDRASFVMSLMGFDPVRKVFNRQVEFGRTVMTACLPFYRLGLTPTEGQILSFITILEADDRPLPIFGSDDGGGGGGGETGGSDYSGIPDAPWGATYGMGTAMQNVVLRSAQFRLNYPAVTGLANIAFNNWLRDVMFRGVSGGDESLIIEMMNTIFPQNIRQGAAMAFRSELAWVALESDYVVAPEQQIQLQAATTILNFQLNGVWDAAYGKKNPYSKKVVESLLSSVGLSTSGGAAVFRGPPRSYQGVFGSGPAVASASTKSVAATMSPRVSGEVRVSTSAAGTYSATLTMANGMVHRFKGVLKGDGSIQDQWAPGLSVNLTPVEDGVAKYLGGTVSFGSNAATAVAGRLIYSKDAPFGSPGNYTLTLRIDPAPAASARLQGSGFATVKISSAGVARFAGRLADNTPFTGSFPVWGATGEPGEQALLVHRALAKGAGAIGGRISRRNGGVGSGDMIWNVAPTAVGTGGELSLEATLSLYRGVSNGSVLPFGWPWNASFSLDWNAGSEFGAVGFVMPGTLFGSDAGLLLKVNASSGLVGGSFTDAETGAKYKIGGILDQATKTIDGFFLTPDSSGRLEINR